MLKQVQHDVRYNEKMETTTGPKFLKAKVIEHKILSGKFHHFVMETESPFNFVAGQYISIKVAEDRINSYSIAGRVADNRFELLIDTTPAGPGSIFFEKLKEGEEVSYLGPFGIFGLKPEDGAEVWLFMATGSGISPIKAMIETALKEMAIEKQIYFYFGLRYVSDIFWKDYFETLAVTYPNFHFKLCLSKADESWQGLKGHITDYIKTDFADASKLSAYLCGNKAMIEEAIKILSECNCPSGTIYKEIY